MDLEKRKEVRMDHVRVMVKRMDVEMRLVLLMDHAMRSVEWADPWTQKVVTKDLAT